MIPEKTLTIGGTEHRVCFTARARYLFEERAGYPLHLSKLAEDYSDREAPIMLYAGLEGARLRAEKSGTNGTPAWTVVRCLDLLDDLDPEGRQQLRADLLLAVSAAYEGTAEHAPEDDPEGKASTET